MVKTCSVVKTERKFIMEGQADGGEEVLNYICNICQFTSENYDIISDHLTTHEFSSKYFSVCCAVIKVINITPFLLRVQLTIVLP